MALWTDLATYVGPTPNKGGAIVDHLYVVEHIAAGTFAGTIAWQKNPDANVSSHFIVAKDGRIAQMVDTNVQAWTQIQGNPYSISIENEGQLGDALTQPQVDASARLLERAHREHGVPLQVTSRVGTPGLGHHSMGYESGVNWGHQFCPGDPIKAQKQTIVTLAKGGSMATGDADTYAKAEAWRTRAMVHLTDPVEHSAEWGEPNEPNELAKLLLDMKATLDGLTVGAVDIDALVAALVPALAANPAFRQLLVDAANQAEDT
jgi:hypothetical protein